MRAAILIFTGLGLAGCHLVDQTSFGGAPRAPAPSELTAALASRGDTPLLVVRPDDGVPYGDALREALQGAEARNGNARFRVEAIVPAQGDLGAQQAALDAATVLASQVVDEMGSAGIAADRVTLRARTDGHVLRREIRIYQG